MTHDMTQPSDEQIEQSELFNLERAIDSLVEGIRQYESDTFSASVTGGIDGATAKRMAAYLIHTQLFDPYGIPGESIDGATVGLAYDSAIEAKEKQMENQGYSDAWIHGSPKHPDCESYMKGWQLACEAAKQRNWEQEDHDLNSYSP